MAAASDGQDALRELANLLRNSREDPTANVLKLVESAILRQDDLRKAQFRRIDELIKQESYWRTQLAKSERRAADAAALAEQRRVDALLAAAAAERALERSRAEQTASALAERVDAAQKALATTAGGTGLAKYLGNLAAAVAGALAAYLALHR
jgi:VIT1/CCC1 family predicted Fe2+/Mn2+ transporter